MQIRMRRTGFAAMFLDATRRNLMGTNHLITKAALIANGVAMMLVYPLNMMVLERTSWIWDAPSRNPPLEHMLVAVYVTMGAFLISAARDPVRFLPLIDFVIVSGATPGTRREWRSTWPSGGTSSALTLRP